MLFLHLHHKHKQIDQLLVHFLFSIFLLLLHIPLYLAILYLKRETSEITVVGVSCEPEAAIPGVRTLKKLGEISFNWKDVINHRVEIGTKESYKKSLLLCRLGLMAGPSSGFALAGLLKFLEEQKNRAGLEKLRNKDGDVVAVFICPDTPFPYLDKYSTHLDASDF